MQKDTIWQGTMADYWFEEDGILYALSKEAPRTAETIRENFELLRQITKGKKVCVIIDNTHTSAYDIDAFKVLFDEFQNACKAVAFVPRSSIGKMVSDISEQLNPPGFIPIRIFETTQEARSWIRNFCR